MKRTTTLFLFCLFSCTLFACVLVAGTARAQQTYAKMTDYGIYEAKKVEVTYEAQNAGEDSISTVEASLSQLTRDVPLTMGTTFGFEYTLHCPNSGIQVLYSLRLPDGRQVTAPKSLTPGDHLLTFTISSSSGFEWVPGDYRLSLLYQEGQLIGQTFSVYQP